MRIATYNIEWFANLFDRADHLTADDLPSGHDGSSRAQQAEALATVFRALDADALMIVEAPNTGRKQNTIRALEGFAQEYGLRTTAAAMGFPSPTHQELALLYDPAKLSAEHDPRGRVAGPDGSARAPRFDGAFRIDLDADGQQDLVRFSKPPMELALTTASGTALRLIGVHLKSLSPRRTGTHDEIMARLIADRRKQLAQAVWIRSRIDMHLAEGDHVILMGDLNDGPGLFAFEDLFSRSSFEILLGREMHDPHARAALQRPGAGHPTTTRYKLEDGKRYAQALMDYAMLSPGLVERGARWRVWHPFDDVECWETPALRDALLAASDHFPVTVDLEI
ncbi:endonuclease/exonuclease/phosphatase family protein [Chachezhania antarctica]|uniref:endonuclease/exonuclease/phosphatase family protein n=1 Tax=Chachezhania antarctica TaxID=2340860 RepID=UPI000EB314EF|nr:endonuclease/exonuclease/phosphatase family protein [Chachezhania antarctica]|tara:strand:- start:535 stop:1548 length:1014 start_codon:yes stop_codon:yes gene_type:complete